ncbi:hypothetical protein IWW36_004946, partial [Coemansia brasiliensis]
MTCNIFDVVLHPSLFQQRQQQQQPYYQQQSSDIAYYSASAPMSKSSASCMQESRGEGDVSATPWSCDDWAEIRKRLWNAKCHVD